MEMNHMRKWGALVLCFISLLTCPSIARDEKPKEPITEALFLRFFPPNTAAMNTAPQSLFASETPMIIRYTFMGGVAIYEPQAACHPKALSFFGTKDLIPPAFCPEEVNIKIRAYMLHRALVGEFPNEMASYERYIRLLGLTPDANNMNTSTVVGWANDKGKRLADFMAKDGWNSLGDLSRRANRARFEDYTDYRPVNNPYSRPVELFKPLRWQPLLRDEVNGRFSHQIHVTPHIGVKVRPLVLTENDMAARQTKGPYFNPEKKGGICKQDRALVKKYVLETIKISSSLTTLQKFEADWWDNKLFSIATIDSFYEKGLTRFEVSQQFLCEILAQYETLLLTWREKRRNDLVRPRTMVERLLGTKLIKAYDRGSGQVKIMRGKDWRGYLKDQPHSEFPSGSSALCVAAMEALDSYQKFKFGFVAPINITYGTQALPFVPKGGITVLYDSPAHAANICAESRLWGGVHFRPSTIAGKNIGKGIGKLVFKHLQELGEGRVPKNCWRCKT